MVRLLRGTKGRPEQTQDEDASEKGRTRDARAGGVPEKKTMPFKKDKGDPAKLSSALLEKELKPVSDLVKTGSWH